MSFIINSDWITHLAIEIDTYSIDRCFCTWYPAVRTVINNHQFNLSLGRVIDRTYLRPTSWPLSFFVIFDCTLSAASFNSLTDTTFAEGSALGAAHRKSQNNFFTSGSSHNWNAQLADIVAWSACALMAAVSPGLNGISIPQKTWVVRSVCFCFSKVATASPWYSH